MFEAIKNFASQFAYEPKIENDNALKPATKFLVIGMGGSHLAADLLKVWDPALDVIVSQDYELPILSESALKDRLIILSSYSGNTEEVLSAFEDAGAKNLPRAIVSIGGKLLELAQKHNIPYIQMPDTGIQPRSALGFNLMALLTFMGKRRAIAEARQLSSILKPLEFENQGRELANRLNKFVPVIYSSLRNLPVAYNWKIKFNETGKIPAFYNVFSELNHNEMTGFDAKGATSILAKNFYFLLLEDDSDTPKIKKRMQVLAKLYRDRDIKVEFIKLANDTNIFYKIFSSLILADWVAYYTAKSYGVEPEQVPMVEEFKKLIQ
ncbi:MAG: hypothetical protein HYT28_03005 [Parcubacteria group bacterium]|nr:hypothetical protein [Parcubacteria group bacterium]